MNFKTLITRAIALVALTAGLVTVGQIPNVAPHIAQAALTYAAPTNPSKISAGDGFLCIDENGSIACSGSNSDGQLGDGTTTSRNYLKLISSGDKIKSARQLAVGKSHACAVAGTGSVPGAGVVYCWGDNQYGQLGNNSTTDSSVPVEVAGGGDFTNASVIGIVAGDNHTCAIKMVSSVTRLFCWGLNNKGQLGDNTLVNKSIPTAVQGTFASGAVYNTSDYFPPMIAAGGEHTCAAKAVDNIVYCWGENSSGQLGNGTTTDSPVPVSTGSASTSSSGTYITSITAGYDFTCNFSVTGLRCWGENSSGQMGNGNTTDVLTPTAVPAVTGFANNNNIVSITAGGQTMCATTNASKIWCWGKNNAGQVGDNTLINKTVPTLVLDNPSASFTNGDLNESTMGDTTGARGIAVSRSITDGFACVTKWCWGANNDGQLAQTNTTDVALPSQVKIGTISADEVTGVVVTATLKSGGVEVTFTGLPDSSPSRMSVTVAPTSQTLAPNQFVVPGSLFYWSTSFTNQTITNGSLTVTVPRMKTELVTMTPPGTQGTEEFTSSGSYHVTYNLAGPVATSYPDGWTLRNARTTGDTVAVSGGATTTTTTVPTTSTGATNATTTTTTVPTAARTNNSYATAVAGVTVTDPTVYTTAPTKVAGDSAISVLTDAQAKTMDIVSKTPSVCLPNDEDLVFLDEGKCIAEVVNVKTRKVLRTLKTTVVSDDIADLKVGNEIAVLAPLYFRAGTAIFKASSLTRLASLKSKILSAGSVLVAGHSGNLMGNTPENISLSKERASAAVAALKARGSKGPFAIAAVGALDPASNVQTQAAQDKNRRVVIVLIP